MQTKRHQRFQYQSLATSQASSHNVGKISYLSSHNFTSEADNHAAGQLD